MDVPTRPQNIGRNIALIRLLLVMKRETLAKAMGVKEEVLLNIEESPIVGSRNLELVAKALGVTVEGIMNFSEDAVIEFMAKSDAKGSNVINTVTEVNDSSLNTLDKLLNSYEENKKLYERLLNVEREKLEYLERLCNK